jgi:hypothetical protein
MNANGFYVNNLTRLLGAVLLLFLLPKGTAAAADDASFPLLQIGTRTYTNVTVTTKAKDYVLLLHATGMASIKVASLTSEERLKLGYTGEANQRKNGMAGLFKSKQFNKINLSGLTSLESQAKERWGEFWKVALPKVRSLSLLMTIVVASSIVLIYLLFCYGSMLICRKTQEEAGVVAWLPVLQILPLLRAARMSPLWFVPCLLVVPCVLVLLIWSVKISRARGKSLVVAFFLILPITFPLAFLYLAFSDGQYKKAEQVPELMVLEAA